MTGIPTQAFLDAKALFEETGGQLTWLPPPPARGTGTVEAARAWEAALNTIVDELTGIISEHGGYKEPDPTAHFSIPNDRSLEWMLYATSQARVGSGLVIARSSTDELAGLMSVGIAELGGVPMWTAHQIGARRDVRTADGHLLHGIGTALFYGGLALSPFDPPRLDIFAGSAGYDSRPMDFLTALGFEDSWETNGYRLISPERFATPEAIVPTVEARTVPQMKGRPEQTTDGV